MKKSRFEEMKEETVKQFEGVKAERIAENMDREFNMLCENDSTVPKDFVKHCHNNIYPAAAAYKALLREGMEKDEALKLANDTFLKLMEAPANAIRNAMKVPGLYKLMPWLWKTMMPKLFSPQSGFDFKFYPVGKDRVKFDMTSCPYYNMCKKIGCVELAPTFCTTDDVCYGNMHPKLIWNRTKTIARGGDLCDFDLYIDKK